MKINYLAPILCALTALVLPGYGQDGATNEIDKLKALLAEQQRQIETLRQAVAEQQKMIEGLAKPAVQAVAAAPAAPSAGAPAAATSAAQRPLIASTSPVM